MDELCEFCWLTIFSNLELKDRMTAVQVWPYILPLWKRLHRILYHNQFIDALTSDEYEYFLTMLHNKIEIMVISAMNYMHEEIFKTFTFRNVQKLCITLRGVAYSDKDIKLLTRMFPNIQTIRLKYVWGPFSGRYFKNWHRLRNISLARAGCLEVEYLREMMEELPLQNIELPNIGTDIELLGYEIFSKLRKLTIYSYQMRWFLCGPTEELGNLKFFGIICYEQGGAEAISEFFHYFVRNQAADLMKLTIEYSSSAVVLLGHYRYALTDLSEIHLRICHIKTEYDFINLLQNYKQLRTLKLESCNFGFQSCRINVAEIVQQRTYPLTLRYDSLLYQDPYTLNVFEVQIAFESPSAKFMAEPWTFPPSI